MFRRVLAREMQWRFQFFFCISSRKEVIRDNFFLKNGQFLLKTIGSLLVIVLLQITAHRC